MAQEAKQAVVTVDAEQYAAFQKVMEAKAKAQAKDQLRVAKDRALLKKAHATKLTVTDAEIKAELDLMNARKHSK